MSWAVNTSFSAEELLSFEVLKINIVSIACGQVYKSESDNEEMQSYKLSDATEPYSIPLFLINLGRLRNSIILSYDSINILTDGQDQWARVSTVLNGELFIIKDCPELNEQFKERIRNKIRAKFN